MGSKYTKNEFQLGLRSELPLGEAYSVPSDPLAGLEVPL